MSENLPRRRRKGFLENKAATTRSLLVPLTNYMRKYLPVLTALALLFACTPEENGADNNQSGNGGDKIVHVTGISLDRNSATIKEGEYITLVATVTPSNADNKSVSWSSSSDAVATVDASGKVTGVKAGSATITATAADGGMKATCSLSVEANLAPSVTVEAKNVSAISAVLAGKANLSSTVASDLKVGFQYSKSAGILSSNSTTIEATDADAFYNYTAAITGLAPETKYYFRSFVRQNGQDTYGETMEFTTKDVSSLLETKDASAVEATKATMNAKLDLTDVQYKSLAYGFLWGTSESALNTDYKCTEISDNAISAPLTGLSHKTQYWYKAYVKLDSQTFYGEVKTFTTDVVPVESVSLDKTEYTFNTIGNTLTLTATVLPADATDKSVSWSSSSDAVATVDASGKVTAVSKGTATIKAEAKDGSGKYASCSVTVKTLCPSGAVDLGLSVYWGTTNIGASKPEDYGDYYAWGETEPKESYSWSTYKFGTSSSGPFFKYNTSDSYGTVDNKTVLEPEDDVARVKLGGEWRMPTDAEWTELRTKCTWTWTTNYNGTGVKGQIVTATNGNSIFLPAAGYRRDTKLYDAGSYGYYWSSSLNTDKPSIAWYVNFNSGTVRRRDYGYRSYGQSVRPVSE